MVKETWKRFLLKTGTWRILAFTALAIITYIVTGSFALAAAVSVADWIVKSLLYAGHEWIWSKSNYGRKTMECKKGTVLWFTGLSGSGKTTLADEVARRLEARMIKVKRLDGDVARRTFSSDLGFTSEDRKENCKRAAHVASYLSENNIVLASFISPYQEIRSYVRKLCKDSHIVYVKCHISECASRDPKGMYAQLFNGKFKGEPFTGMHPSAPFEIPLGPEVTVDTGSFSLEECADGIIEYLEDRDYV